MSDWNMDFDCPQYIDFNKPDDSTSDVEAYFDRCNNEVYITSPSGRHRLPLVFDEDSSGEPWDINRRKSDFRERSIYKVSASYKAPESAAEDSNPQLNDIKQAANNVAVKSKDRYQKQSTSKRKSLIPHRPSQNKVSTASWKQTQKSVVIPKKKLLAPVKPQQKMKRPATPTKKIYANRKKVTLATTPLCLKRSLTKKRKDIKSSEAIELETIANLQKETSEHIQLNKAVLQRAVKGPALKPIIGKKNARRVSLVVRGKRSKGPESYENGRTRVTNSRFIEPQRVPIAVPKTKTANLRVPRSNPQPSAANVKVESKTTQLNNANRLSKNKTSYPLRTNKQTVPPVPLPLKKLLKKSSTFSSFEIGHSGVPFIASVKKPLLSGKKCRSAHRTVPINLQQNRTANAEDESVLKTPSYFVEGTDMGSSPVLKKKNRVSESQPSDKSGDEMVKEKPAQSDINAKNQMKAKPKLSAKREMNSNGDEMVKEKPAQSNINAKNQMKAKPKLSVKREMNSNDKSTENNPGSSKSSMNGIMPRAPRRTESLVASKQNIVQRKDVHGGIETAKENNSSMMCGLKTKASGPTKRNINSNVMNKKQPVKKEKVTTGSLSFSDKIEKAAAEKAATWRKQIEAELKIQNNMLLRSRKIAGKQTTAPLVKKPLKDSTNAKENSISRCGIKRLTPGSRVITRSAKRQKTSLTKNDEAKSSVPFKVLLLPQGQQSARKSANAAKTPLAKKA